MSTPPSRKIVVLTPVKNEAWILPRFLATTSLWADHIVICDQHSTDGSRDLYGAYGKVDVIDNDGVGFDEAHRQDLMLAHARERYGTGNVLIALDADEILAANATETLGWQTMLAAPAGTVLVFEAPTFYQSPYRVLRYYQPRGRFGFVDDGTTQHDASIVHGKRVPQPYNPAYMYVHDVKVMHYSMTRPLAQAAKMRFYAALENAKGTRPWFRRRLWYRPGAEAYTTGDAYEDTPREWFAAYEARGIDMTTIVDREFTWQDEEVARLIREHGARRFHKDPIWAGEWIEHVRRTSDPDFDPPRPSRTVERLYDLAFAGLKRLRHFVKA